MADFRHTIAVDRIGMIRTHARACGVSSEYYMVRVPYVISANEACEILTELNEDQRRFVTEDVTPEEYKVEAGLALPSLFDRSR